MSWFKKNSTNFTIGEEQSTFSVQKQIKKLSLSGSLFSFYIILLKNAFEKNLRYIFYLQQIVIKGARGYLLAAFKTVSL